jgi:hypothetical protein
MERLEEQLEYRQKKNIELGFWPQQFEGSSVRIETNLGLGRAKTDGVWTTQRQYGEMVSAEPARGPWLDSEAIQLPLTVSVVPQQLSQGNTVPCYTESESVGRRTSRAIEQSRAGPTVGVIPIRRKTRYTVMAS